MFGRYIRLLGSLLQKEAVLRIYNPFDAIVALLEPAVLIGFIITLLVVSGRRSNSPLGGPVELFLTTGFYALYLFLYTSRRLRIPTPRKRLPIEKRLDYLIVHFLLRTIEFALLGVAIFGILYFVSTDRAIPVNLPAIFEAVAAIVMLSFGWLTFTMTVGAMFPRRSRALPIIFAMLGRSLIFFSGVFYVADFMEPNLRYYISFNPLLHAVTLFRLGFYPQHPHIIYDGAYLAYCCLASVALGLVVERITGRHELTEQRA